MKKEIFRKSRILCFGIVLSLPFACSHQEENSKEDMQIINPPVAEAAPMKSEVTIDETESVRPVSPPAMVHPRRRSKAISVPSEKTMTENSSEQPDGEPSKGRREPANFVEMSSINPPLKESGVYRLAEDELGMTADQQSNSRRDISVTRDIRRAVMSRKDLSIAAHNVKIITIGGRVTLMGRVHSEMEREAIEEAAIQVVGVDKVRSGLYIRGQEAGR